MGYACECTLTLDQQIDLVAEFHVHRIRPSRIAYRLGIDIAQVEAWLSGEQDIERFQRLIDTHRRRKFQRQVRRADRLRGQQAYEMRLAAQQDLQQDNVMDRPHIGGEQRSVESRGT
jgi:trehalose-6-phosphate synthase